jgi:hypothetical protein
VFWLEMEDMEMGSGTSASVIVPESTIVGLGASD